MSERIDLADFIGGFVVEAEELVGTANALLLELESAAATKAAKPKAVRDLFRCLHTIKGLAGMVGVEPIVELAHALEALVKNADRAGGRLPSSSISVSLEAIRAIGERVRAVAEKRPQVAAPSALLDALAAAENVAEAAVAPPPLQNEWEARLTASERQQVSQAFSTSSRVYAVMFVPSEVAVARGISIATVRARLAELGDIVKVVPRSLPPADGRARIGFDILVITEREARDAIAEVCGVLPDEVSAIAAPPAPASTPPIEPLPLEADDLTPLGRSLVRVELARLDALQDNLSSLITTRFRLDRELVALGERGTDVRGLREVVELQARQLRQLRRAILRVRMVRVAEVLEPLTLLIRSLARPGVKEVKLEVDARDAEVDKAVADRLLPAIIHLVRNAVDHAIEPVEERVALGKPRAGTLRVTCAETGANHLELVIGDDGRGIDRDTVARRAGRAIANDTELLDVITTPGFSTRDATSSTSGRGFGLDIVKRVAEGELGGTLELTTELGQGTSFRMRVPLTIAIVEVFSFSCGAQAFVVPATTIEEILEIDPERIVRTPDPAGARAPVAMIERGGRVISLLSLRALLALDPDVIDSGATARKALVIRRDGELVAFTVDRLLGRQEVVVRPILDPLATARGIAGATDLGDGRPTLVLDLFELGGRRSS